MSRYIFDIETNGLIDSDPVMDRIHCVCLFELETQTMHTFRSDHPGGVWPGLVMASLADELIGHNIQNFDLAAIKLVFPKWTTKAKITDTLIISRLIWTNMKDLDFAKARKGGTMPGNLNGRHSLESWGYRLGFHKGDYSKNMKAKGLDPWAAVNDDMVAYCENDVLATACLYERIKSKNYSQLAIDLEHRVAAICDAQTRYGVWFNEKAAAELYAALSAEHATIASQLRAAFGSWWQAKGLHTTKRSMKRRALGGTYEYFEKDAQHTKIELVEFNPASRDHIANRLIVKYGWKPKSFTTSGKPEIDEEVLSGMKFPEAKLLSRYLLVEKRIGQIAEGKQAWLKVVRKNRIHGRVNTNGAVTGRATHSDPNLGQVPRVGSAFGVECRSMFGPSPGRKLVGADASGLELRCLAHYMAKWDNGVYANAVVNGKSEDETDVHSLNCKALGFEPKTIYTINGKQVKGRDIAKTFIYAFLYGAGDEKIGSIVGGGKSKGKQLKATFLAGLPALGNLIKAVKARASTGALRGLDGRLLLVRSSHSALNTLLQGAGAIVMKQAMVNLHDQQAAIGNPCGTKWQQLLWIHDEFQCEADEDIADALGFCTVQAIRKVTEDFDFRCPLDGEYKVGSNWAETH